MSSSTKNSEIEEVPTPPPPISDVVNSNSDSFNSAMLDENAANIIEPQMSFGEPLHVSISRATTRFSTIQRAHSRQRTELEELEAAEEEEAAAAVGR
ncbi:hypothetical protein GGH95_006880, partial [Coemansia sp. RSA 1836]